jgi:actin-related protein
MALSCVTPLYLTGKYSGIVVSGGASSFEMMAVYEGYPLFRQFQHIPIGTQSLNKFIRDDLALINS